MGKEDTVWLIEKLADLIGIDRSTLYRKISNNGDTITIKEADLIVKELNLTLKDANDIFFSQYVAQDATKFQRRD